MPEAFDPLKIREEFPILETRVRGRPLIYLDNAATTQKPRIVLEALDDFYRKRNANVHRSSHSLSAEATKAYELARSKVQRFLDAASPDEVVFVRGATEAINLVAATWGRRELHPGDSILLTEMEHHSNIVPWQLLCEHTGAELRVVPVDDEGNLIAGAIGDLIDERTRLLAVTQVSNALGTVNDIQTIVELAHDSGVKVLVDGAQAVPHFGVSVRDLDADFYVFSGHKVYAPTGIGVLYAKTEILKALPPYQGGGEMIRSVSFAETTYQDPPHRFEAGTPAIADAVGLGAAIDFFRVLNSAAVEAHETALLEHAEARLRQLPGVRVIGRPARRVGALSFLVDALPAHDTALALDQDAIAVRAGHHCAQPLMHRLGVPSTVRLSVAVYNTKGDIDRLVEALEQIV